MRARFDTVQRLLPRGLYSILLPHLLSLYWNKFENTQTNAETAKVSGLSHSERGVLYEQILRRLPLSSMLEIGCGLGLNLPQLANILDLSATQYVGIDRNENIIAAADRRLEVIKQGKKIELLIGDAASGLPFPDKNFDLVFTLASLLYVSSKEILKVAEEILRLGKKTVILVEQHVENNLYAEQDLGVFIHDHENLSGYWLRDYKRLFLRFLPEERIKVIKVPMPRFDTEQWQETAHAICLDLW